MERGIMNSKDEISTAAATLGRKGGASRSEAKQAAVRENGRKGGRPKLTDQQKMIKKNVLEHHSGVKAVRFRDGFVEVRREEGWTTHDTIHGAYSQALLDNYYEAPKE